MIDAAPRKNGTHNDNTVPSFGHCRNGGRVDEAVIQQGLSTFFQNWSNLLTDQIETELGIVIVPIPM